MCVCNEQVCVCGECDRSCVCGERVCVCGERDAGRHPVQAIKPQWLMTHGYDCTELYESRYVRLSTEQANALMAAGCVLSKVDG